MVSAFLKVEGKSVKNRILSFLVVHSDFDYSMKEIAKHSKVSYTSLKAIWEGFRQNKIVVRTRMVGKAKMYRLNLKNPVVNKFIDYYWAVVDSVVRRENNIQEEEKEPSYKPSVSSVAVSARNL